MNLLDNKKVLLAIVVAATLWIALDGNHYWHDVRFLYASSQFSLKEILSGFFNPHQLGGKIDEISSGGFYFAKVLHIYFLQILFKWIPPAKGGLSISILISLLCMGLSILISHRIFLRLFRNKRYALLAVFSLLLMPVTPYLGGKLLSEVTALFLVTISIWTFTVVRDVQESNSKRLAIISGVFLLLAGLARLDIILCFWGFFVALFLSTEGKEDRIKILKAGGIVSAIFVVGYLSTMYSLGMGIESLIRYFREFVGEGTKSNIMSLLGILTFGGIVYVFALGAIFSYERKRVLFLVIWFCLSAGAAILITRNYMVEPRYLISGLLPLAGLGGLGFEVLWQKIANIRFRWALVAGMATVIIVFNLIVVKLMPYELDRPALLKAVDRIIEKDDNAAIMIPWAYTDFHFLRVMLPDIPIFNVQSIGQDGQSVSVKRDWRERLDKWYGEAYISSPVKLDSILAKRPTYYLGWRKYPPIENAKKIVDFLGMRRISNIIDSIPAKNHLAESWMWDSDAYSFKLAGKCSQYEYYKVDLQNGR